MALDKWGDVDDNKIFYTTYLEAIVQALDQDKWVRTGGEVTAQSPNAMKVDIAASGVYYDGTDYSLSSSTVSLSSSETAKDRVDVMVWDYNGGSPQYKLKTGDTWATYGSTEFPLSRRLDADEIPLAYVIVDSAASSIANTDIYDVRFKKGNDLYNLKIGGTVVMGSDKVLEPVATGYSLAVSDNIFHANNGEVTTTNTSMTKLKEIDVSTLHGVLRTYFEIRVESSGYHVYGRVYRNGVAVGTLREITSDTYTAFTEDISNWKPHDLFQIFAYTSDSNETVYIRNQRMKGDCIPSMEQPTTNL